MNGKLHYEGLAELARPWKLSSFAIGMSWLLYGATTYHISDWDIGISLLMGTLTYICAPWSVRTFIRAVKFRRHNWLASLALVLLVSWFVIDGVYVLYHTLMGNQMLREENFYASTPLYFLAGIVWLYRGSLRELVQNIGQALRGNSTSG